MRFRQHEEFHRAALSVVIAAPLAAVVSSILPGGIAMTVAVASAAAAIAAMSSIRGSRSSRIVSGSLLAALGGAFLVATSVQGGGGHVGPLLFALLVALPLASGLRGRKLLISVAAGVGALLLARLAAIQVANASDLQSLPAWGNSALAGLAVSAASIFALVPRHIDLVKDPVAGARAQLQGQVGGEIAELVERGNQLWTQAKSELEEGDANRQILEEAVLRLMETAQRWSDATSQASTATSAEKLAERLDSLEQRIAKADDQIVINQYEQARSALSEQLKYLSGISKNRERVLARMHNYLAAMERLRLAVANLKSTTASQEAIDLAPMVENLEELGQDIDSCSAAIVELPA